MTDNLAAIEFPTEIVHLKYPLMRLRQALDGKGAVRIVAMGSSSTAGRGDVVPYSLQARNVSAAALQG